MCVEIEIDGRLFERLALFEHYVGARHLALDQRYPPSCSPAACLCPVDIGATAAQLGLIVDDSDAFVTRLRPPTAPARPAAGA